MSSGSSSRSRSSPVPTGGSENGKSWPDSLENFIDKSLSRSKLLSPKYKLAVQEQIKELMATASTNGKIYTNDWSKQRLPALDNGVELILHCDAKATKRPVNGTPKETTGPSEVQEQRAKRKKPTAHDSDDKKRKRLERFNDNGSSHSSAGPSLPNKPDFTANGNSSGSGTFLGRCQKLEKSYYRLTSDPDPNLVRPQSVLQRAMKRLIDLVDEKPYSYIKDQFKAIRQDMTVQHIKNDFSMYVYETNARISIKNNDLGEMNQCVTQLEYFFDSKSVRNNHLNRTELEFMCYRILYMLMVENHSEIFKIKYKILNRKYSASDELEKLKFVKLSFELQNLMLSSNYYKYFRLIEEFKPLPLAYTLIVNFLMEKQKLKTLNIMVKSYRKFNLDLLSEMFDVSVKEVEKFLKFYKLFGFVQNSDIDCTVLRPHVFGLMAKTNFKKIDIKGQV